MKRSTFNIAFLLFSFQFLFLNFLVATTINIPGDYATIQAGILFSNDGDTVLVAPGIYSGSSNKNIELYGRKIVLISSDGPNNTIIDCESDGNGFDIKSDEDNSTIISGFTIINANNWPDAGIALSSASPIIRNCIIKDCYWGILGNQSNPNIENCIIKDNAANGIRLSDMSYSSIIKNCIVQNSGSNGIYIYGYSNSQLILENTIISGNQQHGIRSYYYGSIHVKNSTITDNYSTQTGGGVYMPDNVEIFVHNSIIWGNTSNTGNFDNFYSINSTVTYSNIGGTGWPGTGNINANPLFVDPANNDFRLMANSPCIDTADNSVIDFPTDLAGNVRIWDGDGNGDARVDMGAYEFGAPPYQLLGITGQPVGTTVCEGEEVEFTVSATGILLTYQWFHNNNEITGATDSTLVLSNVSNANAGNYTCVVTDFVGSSATSQPATLSVNTSVTPNITINSTTVPCEGNEITFSATTENGGNNPTYQWQLNGMVVGTNAAMYTANGLNADDTVTCILTSSEQCLFENNVVSNAFSVLPLPTVSITNNSMVICENEPIDIIATGGGSYSWDGPNNYSGYGESVNISSATTPMNGTYTVSVTDAAGCSSIDSTMVAVNPLPPVSYLPTDSTLCINSDPIDLMGGAPAGGNYSGNGINANTLDLQAAGLGSLNVTYSYSDPATGCSNSDTATIEINALPDPSISGNNVICSGETTELSVSVDHEIAWSNGASTPSISVSPISDQDYSVTVTNMAGCSDFDMFSVMVNPVPTPAIEGDLNICDGETTTLTATGGTSYNWSSGEDTDSIEVATTGSYTVTATNDFNCHATATVAVTVHMLPSVVYDPLQTTFCSEGDPIVLSGGTPAGGEYSGTGVSGNMFDPAAAGIGDHLISYSYEDPTTGCSNDATASLHVSQTLPVSVGITASTDTICADAEVIFTANPLNEGASPTYQWYVNGDPAGGNAASFVTDDLSTGDVISCEVTSSEECASGNPATASFTVTAIYGLPGEPSASNDGGECEGGNIKLSAFAAGAHSYKWSGPNNFMSDSAMVILENVTLADTGTYTAVITNIVGCSVEVSTNVMVYPNPDVAIGDGCLPDTVLTTTPPFLLDCGSPIGGEFYCDSTLCTVFDPAAAGVGEHTITYQYIDPNGCSGSFSTTVIVEMGTASEEQFLQNQFNIFPNPSNGNFIVRANSITGKANLQLMNTLGQPVWHSGWDMASEHDKKVSIDGIPKGVYWLVLEKEGHMISKRIVFQ